MRHAFKAALLAFSSLASSLALPAFAEDELVVTATRTPVAAERLPARVEIIDREEIEARSLATLTDAIGPQAVQGGGAGQQASAFLRGANSKHALALFDGVRLNDASAPNAAYDFGQDTLGAIERVEVLRGPASTVYGSDAIGGVVNLIPRRGGAIAFAPFLEIAAGSFNGARALAGAAGAAGAVEYGASVETYSTGGFDQIPARMATHTGDADGAEVRTFTASMRRDSGVFAFDALLRRRESRAEYDTFSGGPGFDLRADDADLENDAEQTLWRVGGEMQGGTALVMRLSGGQVLSERSETDGGLQTSAADATRSFADVTAAYSFGPVALNAGLSFERNAIDTQPQFANPLSVEEDQTAAFLIGQVDLTDRIVATGSIRLDDNDSFGTHTTVALGAVARFAPVRVFASYATAFKAPSLSERFEQSFFNIGNPDLAPEQAETWEIGLDWRVIGALRVGASYYQTRIEDLIEYRFAPRQNVNVGEAAIDGAETYLEASPAPWATLRFNYYWTDARDTVLDAPLARRPEHAWRFDADVTPTDRLTLTLSWSYVGERGDVTYRDDGTFESSFGTADDFNVASLAARYALTQHADVFARVDNIGDETYEEPDAYAGAPRSGLIGVRASF